MKVDIYGEEFHMVDYKIIRTSENENEFIELDNVNYEYLKKIVMFNNVKNNNNLIFIIDGNEQELNNLNIKSVDTIVSKVFNNLVTNEKFFYNNIVSNTMVLSCDLYSTTSVTKLNNNKFEDIKAYIEFMDNLKYIEYFTVLEYDENKNGLYSAKY